MLLLAVIDILCVSVEGELIGLELAQLVEEGRSFLSAVESDSLAYSTLFIVLKGVLSGTSGLLFYALVMRYRTSFHFVKELAKEDELKLISELLFGWQKSSVGSKLWRSSCHPMLHSSARTQGYGG